MRTLTFKMDKLTTLLYNHLSSVFHHAVCTHCESPEMLRRQFVFALAWDASLSPQEQRFATLREEYIQSGHGVDWIALWAALMETAEAAEKTGYESTSHLHGEVTPFAH